MCHFLVSAQESNQRKRHRGGADQLASSRARAIHYGAIATGNRPILIRCALQHLPCVPLPAALTMALEHLNVESMPLSETRTADRVVTAGGHRVDFAA